MTVGTVPEPKPRSKVSRYLVIVLLVLLALVAGLLGGGNKAKEAASFLVASEEDVYGYPLVMMDVTRQVMSAAANGILSGMPLKYNADGSLDIYMQKDSTGTDKPSNWLRIPASGMFNVTVRSYQPGEALLDGNYKLPAGRKDAIKTDQLLCPCEEPS